MRWGYCCIALGLENSSPAHTISVTHIRRISERRERIDRLARIARENLANTLRLLRYNEAHGIEMYRFSSQLIPLATHAEAAGWEYTSELVGELAEVGEVVRATGIRVSTHPGQYTVVNTPSRSAWQLAQEELAYHHAVLTAMGLDNNAVMVIHVGGAYGDKEKSAQRFIDRFHQLPFEVQERLVIENDDRSYTAADVLAICREIGRPMVLDIHHQRCLVKDEGWLELIPGIFDTWGSRTPKIHVSSPRSPEDPRRHADDVDPEYLLSFLRWCGGRDIDLMVEAKNKDLALFKLRGAVEERLGQENAFGVKPIDHDGT